MKTKKLFKRTLAGLLSAFMVITSVPAASMAVYAEETPVVELAEAVEESTVVETTVVADTEEATSVEATDVVTEEETTTVEETSTEAETSSEEVVLADEQTFKFIFEDVDGIADFSILDHDWDSESEYTASDFSKNDGVWFSVKLKDYVENYAIDQIDYKVGEGDYIILEKKYKGYNIPYNALNGQDITVKCTGRVKAEERTVTIDVNSDVQSITFFTSKSDVPTVTDYFNYFIVEPTDGEIELGDKIEIAVEDKHYLYVMDGGNNYDVIKNGTRIEGIYDTKAYMTYKPLGQITQNTDGIYIDVYLRGETSIECDASKASVEFESGFLKQKNYTEYMFFDGTDDIQISAVAKTGCSIEKIELVPLVTEAGEVTEDTEAAIEFEPDSTHANWYKVDKDKLRNLIRTKVVTNYEYFSRWRWKYEGYNHNGTLLFKIKVTTKYVVTLPGSESGVSVHLATLMDSDAAASAENLSVDEEPATSATVDYNGTIYLAVQVNDPTHKVFGSMTKASGTATLTKVDSNENTVFYRLSGIKSAVTLKATTTLAKAAGGARFMLDNQATFGNVKVTSVKGATYDRANDEYKVNANVSEVVVTLTANAPYVPSLGGAEVAPKVAGAAYSYTFSIPAVDIINTANDETVEIASYEITSESKSVRVDADFNPETTELVSIAEGTIGLYAGGTNWYVPFGSSMTVIVKAKDNCKLTAAYVNDKKVAFAKNEKITFKVTDLESDTFKIDSQKLLKTIVESNGAAITGKGTTYNVLKQYNAAVYVQEGADGKLDLTDENVAITAKIGRDDVPYTISEDKINFTTETIDSVAGKTITVTIKDGKKVVSTTKLVVSAKCTSVKVQGEKKKDGVDTIYVETVTKKEPVLKITYNAGVNPADMVLKYVDASGREAELDISDGVLHPVQMDIISQSDFSLKKEFEVSFVDTSQDDNVVETKKIVFTTKEFENAAPTVKVVSSSDTEVVLSIANPKILGLKYDYCSYTITAKQDVAKGKAPIEGMYGADAENPTVFEDVELDENGRVSLKLTDSSAGKGKACKYTFTVSGSYTVPSNVSFKSVTVKGATKAPAYEKNLKITPKKTSFYQREGEVLVATAKFSTTTTHTEDLKAAFGIYLNIDGKTKFEPIADNDDLGNVRVDADNNIYVDLSAIEAAYPAGSYYIRIEAAKAPDAETGSTAQTKIIILEPIKEINVKYASTETVEGAGVTPIYRFDAGKVLTIKAPKVDFGMHQTGVKDGQPVYASNVPKSKNLKWEIDWNKTVYVADSTQVREGSGISIDAKTGKVTVAKDTYIDAGIIVTVVAKAADFEGNSVKSEDITFVILPKQTLAVTFTEGDETVDPNWSGLIRFAERSSVKSVKATRPVAGATYTYGSSNTDAITVDEDGTITIVGEGDSASAIITVIEKKGAVTKTAKVYVYYMYSES